MSIKGFLGPFKPIIIVAIALVLVIITLTFFTDLITIGQEPGLPSLEEALPTRYDMEDVTWIDNCQSLQEIDNNLNGAYALETDIDCSNTENWNEGKGFKPITDEEEKTPFTGVLLGRGHTITNLNIDRSLESGVGLFKSIDEEGTVKNIGIENADISGNNFVGVLVGVQGTNGKISGSYTTGSVSGLSEVGGLIGTNTGTTLNSYSTASVTGEERVGGLIGVNWGETTNSYATGSVKGDDSGGLISWNEGEVSGCFWDIETTGQEDSAEGIGLTTNEMQDKSTFTDADWDFTTTWYMPENNYPDFIWNQGI